MEKNGNRNGNRIWGVLFGNGLRQTKDRGMDAVGRGGSRGVRGGDPPEPGAGNAGGTVGAPAPAGVFLAMSLLTEGKDRERRRADAFGAGAFAGMETVSVGFVHRLLAGGSLGGDRNDGGKAAENEQAALCPVSADVTFADGISGAGRVKGGGRGKGGGRIKGSGMEGYVVVEAALILPLASIVIVLLIWLGSYLYQGCFLSQAAYATAFRGSRFPERGAGYVQRQLEEIMEGEALRFSEESCRVDSGILSVTVTMTRETPFSKLGSAVKPLYVKQKAAVREAVPYIRGIRMLEGMQDVGGGQGTDTGGNAG